LLLFEAIVAAAELEGEDEAAAAGDAPEEDDDGAANCCSARGLGGKAVSPLLRVVMDIISPDSLRLCTCVDAFASSCAAVAVSSTFGNGDGQALFGMECTPSTVATTWP
jgi:hypothetical protein